MGRWANKYVIGLTGNIATGKSVVRQMLQHLEAYTIDADSLSHRAMAPGAPAYKPVIETFGQFILDADKNIDRNALGRIVFSHPEALAKLEAITHPVVLQAIGTLITRAPQKVVVIEAIKLLDTDMVKAVDEVWVVDASPETQLKRLVGPRKMSEADARQRIAAQGSQADKVAKANLVIRNDGNVEETWKQIQAAWPNVLKKVAGGAAPAAQPSVSAGAAPGAAAGGTAQPAAAGGAAGAAGAVSGGAAQGGAASAGAQPAASGGAAGAAGAVASGGAAQAGAGAASAGAQPSATGGAAAGAAASGGAAQAGAQPSAVGGALAGAASAQPAASLSNVKVTVRRGMPSNAETIANFINASAAKQVSRMDIMMAFGQKSYLLAQAPNDQLLGLMGWQVENLITRVDEFYLAANIQSAPIIEALVAAVEAASKDLQSEVAYIFLPGTFPADMLQSFVESGYEVTEISQIKIPAWREAVQEILSENKSARILTKKLREDRVLKPI